jgi:peptidoglycan/xylan/chitin deacetylase (PgdA/CDA1 family)
MAGQVNMFIYHRFGEPRYPSTNIEPEVFSAQLQYLADQKIPVLPLADVADCLAQGRDLPEHAVVLTVDDAFPSFLLNAMPLLRTHHFPVTLFVNTDSVGTPGYLGWDQLRQLMKEGVRLGNHTATHDYLLERRPGETHDLWRQRVTDDIVRAQQAILRETGAKPEFFAYPYGEYSPELAKIVKTLGFRAAVAQQSGVVGDGADRFTLPRFPMGGGFATLDGFKSKAAMAPLQIALLSEVDPVLGPGETAPQLNIRLSPQLYELERLQGFVQGDNRLVITPVSGRLGEYTVQAEKPLTGRRNKYTLTVPLRSGGWAWFSQPWFRPQSGG